MSAVKDRVRVLLSRLPDLGNNTLQPQPHRKGVVTIDNQDGTRGVLFADTGEFVDNIPDAALETLNNVGQTIIDQFLYEVVRPAGVDASQEYTGIVVDLYLTGNGTFALVKTRGGLFYEQSVLQLVRVAFEGVPQ